MSENLHDPQTDARARKRYQFSLRAILVLVTVLSLLLAIGVRFPRHSTFTVLMTSLLLFPLAVAAAIRVLMVRWGLIQDCWTWQPAGSRQVRLSELPSRAFRTLGLSHTDDCPPLAAAALVAVISTLVVVGLWPVIREVGLQFSLAAYRSDIFSLESARRSMTEAFASSRYWLRLWQWELWSLGRWWLLFGGMLGLWLVASWRMLPASEPTLAASPTTVVPAPVLESQRWTSALARYLGFAPWLVVLEMAFLIGVWIREPSVVPEPSTGFVVGIFAWDLWHWDCWLDRAWLVRGAIPALLAGYVFFTQVIRWPRPAALLAAVILVPIALLLSVACTVAYQHGFPWFG